MLDFFLVLGQVPGTNYFLSFADVLWISLILLLAPLLWRRRLDITLELLYWQVSLRSILAVLGRRPAKIKIIQPGLLSRRIS